MSVFQIMRNRGRLLNFDSVADNNTIEKNEIKNNKYNLYSTKKPIKDDKNKQEELIQIKTFSDGINYIFFQFKNDLKTMNRKGKWKIEISPQISFFLKANKPNEYKNSYSNSSKKKNNNVAFNIKDKDNKEKNIKIDDDINVQNKTIINEIYKREGNNQKIIKKSSHKKKDNNKDQNNNRDIISENSC